PCLLEGTALARLKPISDDGDAYKAAVALREVLSRLEQPEPLPVRAAVRQRIEAGLRTDSGLGAFLLDHFPDAFRQIARGMTRREKVNILLGREDPEDVSRELSLLGK